MTRRILLVAHPGRPEALEVAGEVIDRLAASGIETALPTGELLDGPLGREHEVVPAETGPGGAAVGCELVVVLGGDGTILRGAELARGSGVPVLGVNLGHVGFLAEAEREHLDATVEHIVDRSYTVEERMALEVTCTLDGAVLAESWALNEVTVEKAERMLVLTVEIDGRPLSTWGCDGVVMATPTGSTAYAFSAGGPIVWPGVEALLVVPISAHALFARPMVLSPSSPLAVDLVAGTEGHGVLWCDGRRSVDLPPGSRIEVRRSAEPVRLARLTSSSFTDRLVAKFDLRVEGWRGRREDPREDRDADGDRP